MRNRTALRASLVCYMLIGLLECEALRYQDGSEGESFWDKMRRTYFPEQFGYEPFGDPYEAKRNLHERRRQEVC